jgi:outer membrane lipoprotein-sorting protein
MPTLSRTSLPAFTTLICLSAAILALPASAQQARERDVSERMDGLAAVAGFTTHDAQTDAQESVEIFIKVRREVRLPDALPWIDFVARRQSTGGEDGKTTTWASSEDCPALRNTLIWLTTLVAPRIEIPGITPNEGSPDGRRPRGVTEDGLQTLVWGRGPSPTTSPIPACRSRATAA